MTLNSKQLHWARLIVGECKTYPHIGDADHRERSADLALETALTESSLRMLASEAVPASMHYGHDGVGADHDSIGLFQQRPNWGTPGVLMNAGASTRLFLRALLKLGNWTQGTNWEICQRVQNSAFADGSNYRKNDALAISTRKALW